MRPADGAGAQGPKAPNVLKVRRPFGRLEGRVRPREVWVGRVGRGPRPSAEGPGGTRPASGAGHDGVTTATTTTVASTSTMLRKVLLPSASREKNLGTECGLTPGPKPRSLSLDQRRNRVSRTGDTLGAAWGDRGRGGGAGRRHRPRGACAELGFPRVAVGGQSGPTRRPQAWPFSGS